MTLAHIPSPAHHAPAVAEAEEWRHIPGFPAYDASNQGRVRSWSPRWGKTAPRLMVQIEDPKGYPRVTIADEGGQKRVVRVHILVASAFIGPRPDGLVTRHLDGDQSNNRPSNLAYGTHRENARDSVRHGAYANQRKTHCPQGHAYDAENTCHSGGRRHCRACSRERDRARREAT